MFLICLSLIGLIAVAGISDKVFSAVDRTELIPIPVRVNETKNLRKLG